jgi:hypothetical protein
VSAAYLQIYLLRLKRTPGEAETVIVMPYIKRNSSGRITGILDRPESGSDEALDIENPEVRAYLELARNELLSSDTETIRVIEDLVDLLVEKKLIVFTDLPRAAQKKLSERQRMRGDLDMLGYLVVDEEDIL